MKLSILLKGFLFSLLVAYTLAQSQNCNVTIANCAACNTVPDQCSQCSNAFYLMNGSCLACGDNCNACTSDTVCITCKSPYFNDNGVCTACSIDNCN